VYARELLAGAEGAVDDGAAREALHPRADEGAALPRLHVLELDDAPDVTVDLDVHAVLELVRVDLLGHESNLADGHLFLRERRQHLRAVVRDDDEVLDADAAEAGEVDARLDGDDVASLERARILGVQVRQLVHLQAEAVPEAVAEERAEAGRLD